MTRAVRIRAQPLLIVLGYAAAVVLLFASRLREFADETDNLLGGLLIARGERLYVDYFSSHMPFAYFLSAIPAVSGASRLEDFRLFTNTLLVAVTLAIVSGFRRRLSVGLLGLWATITVFAHTLQWGEMFTASTCAGFGVFVAGLIFYATPQLAFTNAQRLALSAAVFVAVQSELVAVFPLLLLGLCYVAVASMRIWRERAVFGPELRSATWLGLIVAAPHAALVLLFWLNGMLADFVYDAYQFNVVDYSRFVMNSSVTGMLHDWEAQYRTYLLLSLRDPASAQGCLVLANILATWLIFRGRGLASAAVYYLFIALTHIRNEGAYYLCSYFSLALLITWATNRLARPAALRIVGASAVALLSGVFLIRAAPELDLSRRPISSPHADVVQALTSPGERIDVIPYDPYIYLASGRLPASRFPFYFPWQAIEPRTRDQMLDDVRLEQPPVVIFQGDELVNGQWLPREYAKDLYDFLLDRQYAPLDAALPVLRDVLVRHDRLAGAREQLQARNARP